jgi:hypothetical protein
MVVTAIAPEYTYLVANGQREMAKRALMQIEEVRGKHGDTGPEWTITHTFFAEMGGFVLRYRRPPLGNDDDDETRSTTLIRLPVSGIDIAYLLRKRIIKLPSITREEIKERSKADSFAKIVACCQLIWLVIQSVARASQSLPITQLELVTLLDAFCALLTYIAWFQKPYNLMSTAAVYIDVCRIPADVEEALMTKKYSYQIWTKDILPRFDGSKQNRLPNAFPLSVGTELEDRPHSDTTNSNSDYYADTSAREAKSMFRRSLSASEGEQPEKRPLRRSTSSVKESRAYAEETSDETQEQALVEVGGTDEEGSRSRSNANAAAIVVDGGEQGEEKVENNGEGVGEEDAAEGENNHNLPETGTLIQIASPQRTQEDPPAASTGGPKLFDIGLRSPWIFTLLMCMSFGALHCIMWTRVFPTLIELTLWRISSVAITLAVPLYLFCAYSGVSSAKKAPTLVLFTGLYALARLYIIVEAFVSLRAQPREVYEDIDWTKFLPHF